jgi:hypothetical protein
MLDVRLQAMLYKYCLDRMISRSVHALSDVAYTGSSRDSQRYYAKGATNLVHQ